jgi:hypothetical protein
VKFCLEKSPLIFPRANQEDEEDELFYDEAAIYSVLDESKSRSRNITKCR